MCNTLIEIPVIDFEPFIDGDVVAQQAVSRQIYQACHEIGFMYLKNPGIPPSLIEQMFEQAKQFFALPLEIKNQVAWSSAFSNRGYVGVERERLAQDTPGDLKEAFNVGKEVNPKEISKQEQCSLILNQWPEGQVTFRKTVLEFYQTCAEAAEKVCYAFAIALQLPESFFTDKHNQQNYTLRLLHYPPIEQIPKPQQVRAGEHSDYGSFTLLFQDEVGGLEVCTAAGEWIAAPCIPGTVVVNTGDLMQRWTNHVFCSTKHRVRIPTNDPPGSRVRSSRGTPTGSQSPTAGNPPAGLSHRPHDPSHRVKRSRYSIAFFCHPNNDAEIACLESCQEPDCPPLYPPISAGDYLLSRLQATY